MTFDERLALLESEVRTLGSHLRSSAEAEARKEASTLDARLAPGLLPGMTSPGPGGGTPDMGAPLIARMRADGSLRGSFGSTQAAVSSANLLHDPSLNKLPSYLSYQLNTWRDAGAYWQTRLETVSGDVPANPYATSSLVSRDFWGSKGQRLHVPANEGDAGVARVALRSIHPAHLPQTPDASPVNWPYITAAMRVIAQPSGTAPGGGTITWDFENHPMRARVKILDGNTLAVLATGDWTDIGIGWEQGLEGRPYVVLEDWSAVTSYAPCMMLEVEVDTEAATITGGLGIGSLSFDAYFGEPVLAYSEEPGPSFYQPFGRAGAAHPDMIGAVWVRPYTTPHTIPSYLPTQMNFADAYATAEFDHGFRGGPGEEQYFYPPCDGYFEIAYNILYPTPSTGTLRTVQIYRGAAAGGSDTLIKSVQVPPVSLDATAIEVRRTIHLTTNNRFYGMAYHDAGSAIDAFYEMEVRLVRATEEKW